MGFIHIQTIQKAGKKPVTVTSFLSDNFLAGKTGERIVLSKGFGVDQKAPGFMLSFTTHLVAKEKDFVYYETVDGHGLSDNEKDYYKLEFSDWIDGLTQVLEYQPSEFAREKCGVSRTYQMNIGVGGSLAGWLLSKVAERGQESAEKLGAIIILAPAFNFLRQKLAEAVLALLWTNPDDIKKLMGGQMVRSPDGSKMLFHFAQSSEQYEIDVEQPYYTDVPVKIFHGMSDPLVSFQQSVKFAQNIVSPSKPEVHLIPGGTHSFTEDAEFNAVVAGLESLKQDPVYGPYYKAGLLWNEWRIERDEEAARQQYFHKTCESKGFRSVKEALEHVCKE